MAPPSRAARREAAAGSEVVLDGDALAVGIPHMEHDRLTTGLDHRSASRTMRVGSMMASYATIPWSRSTLLSSTTSS